MDIFNEINSIENFTLLDYYGLVEKYGEKEVLLYFKNSKKNDNNFILKYYPVFLMLELDKQEINDNTLDVLISKYNEINVINFFVDFMIVNYNNSAILFKYKDILIHVINNMLVI